MTKNCSSCKIQKELEGFWKNRANKDGKDNLCIECRKLCSIAYKKNNRPKITKQEKVYRHAGGALKNRCKKYGITVAQFEVMLSQQGGKCKICDYSGNLLIDHCHSSGKVRGLLCNTCNLVLGLMRDNVSTLDKAIAYLSEQTV